MADDRADRGATPADHDLGGIEVTSQIDPTVPVFGAPTTASVRNNFLIAKNEIEALQVQIGSGGGGSGFGPPISMNGSGTILLPSSANFFVFVNNTSGAAINLSLPNGFVVGQQVIIKDIAGNAGTYNITITPIPPSNIDENATYVLMSNLASVSLIWISSYWGTF